MGKKMSVLLLSLCKD